MNEGVTRSEGLPLVSVIIPTYNRWPLVCESIDSALAQDYPNFEVIVVDDGSTDGTGEMLQRAYGDRIRYIWQDNAGPAAGRNVGTRAARGEYVAFQDDDDLWFHHKLRTQVQALQAGPQYALAYSTMLFATSDGKPTTQSAYDTHRGRTGDVFEAVLRSVLILPSAAMVRRWALAEVGLFDERMRTGEDTDLFVRLTMRHPAVYIEEPLALMREHPGRGTHSFRHSVDRHKAGILMWDKILALLPPERERFRPGIEANLVISRLALTLAVKGWRGPDALAQDIPRAVKGYEHLLDDGEFHYELVKLCEAFTDGSTGSPGEMASALASGLASLRPTSGLRRLRRRGTFYAALARCGWNAGQRGAAMHWAARALPLNPVECSRHVLGAAVRALSRGGAR